MYFSIIFQCAQQINIILSLLKIANKKMKCRHSRFLCTLLFVIKCYQLTRIYEQWNGITKNIINLINQHVIVNTFRFTLCNNDKIAKNMVSFDKWTHFIQIFESTSRWTVLIGDTHRWKTTSKIFLYMKRAGEGDIVSENAVRNGTDI